MDKSEISDWDVPSPTLRLCLTLVLGALGAFLFPGRPEWLPNPFAASLKAVAAIWLAALLACVILLRLIERKKIQWRRPRLIDVVSAPAIVITAPLLLFAARPTAGNGRSPRMLMMSTALFSIFPYAVATGFTLTLFGFEYARSIPHLGLRWFSFSVWSWMGCAALFLFSPWPAIVRFPKLGDLPNERKIAPLGTILLLAIALLPLTTFAIRPVLYVISGKLFASSFDLSLIGALDQPTLNKGLFLFTYFSLLVAPYVAIARWLSNRRTPLGYWAFADITLVMGIYLFCLLTIPFYQLILYVEAMGFTPRRMVGLIFCAGSYTTLLGFLAWAIWPPQAIE